MPDSAPDLYSINWFAFWLYLLVAYATRGFKWLAALYTGQPLEVQVAISVVMASVAMIMVLLGLIFRRAYIRRQHRKRKKRVEALFEEKINRVLYADEDMHLLEIFNAFDIEMPNVKADEPRGKKQKKLCAQASELLERKYYNDAFVQTIFQSLPRTESEAARFRLTNLGGLMRLFSVFDFMELEVDHGFMARKVNMTVWLGMMRQKVNLWLINTLLKSKNPLVRRQALQAQVIGSNDMELEYYESEFFDRNCCMMDEIDLGYTLWRLQAAKVGLPNLARLALRQQNPEAQCILVRMMRYFPQPEFCSLLEDLFIHSDSKDLAGEIACTWGQLGYQAGIRLMIDVLPTQPTDTKIIIMQALATLKAEEGLEAITEVFTYGINEDLRTHALRCIFHYGEGPGSRFDQLRRNPASGYQNFREFFETFDARSGTWHDDDEKKEEMRLRGGTAYSVVPTTIYDLPKGN